jgi:hypothetical protein
MIDNKDTHGVSPLHRAREQDHIIILTAEVLKEKVKMIPMASDQENAVLSMLEEIIKEALENSRILDSFVKTHTNPNSFEH